MGDVYATTTAADEAVQRQLADVLELRAADLQQRAMLEDYLGDLPLAAGARVLEIGCGTGAVARVLAGRPQIGEVVGIDPSEIFIERARQLAAELPNLSFVVGDGRELPFDDGAFDAVVCHTALCHIPGPERVLAEAACRLPRRRRQPVRAAPLLLPRCDSDRIVRAEARCSSDVGARNWTVDTSIRTELEGSSSARATARAGRPTAPGAAACPG